MCNGDGVNNSVFNKKKKVRTKCHSRLTNFNFN